ncbi:hypothetical protein DN490_36395 [Burkholderia multivorans]|nr:hypothetical protein DN490_36395 [Burkholderia multivorans]
MDTHIQTIPLPVETCCFSVFSFLESFNSLFLFLDFIQFREDTIFNLFLLLHKTAPTTFIIHRLAIR